MTVPLRKCTDLTAVADDAAATLLHPVQRRTVARFIDRGFRHSWIARQCAVSVSSVRGVDRQLRAGSK